jgi:exopolysaccharide biosynthesis polyprenyl glycosylphosphotransferase
MVLSRTVERPSLAKVVTQPRAERRRRSLRGLHLVVADAVAITGSAGLARVVYQTVSGDRQGISAITIASVVITFLVALAVSGSYVSPAKGLIAARPVHGARIWHGLSLGVVLAALAARVPMAVDTAELQFERAALIALIALAAIPAMRLLVSGLVVPRRSTRRVLILGTGRVAASVAGRLQRCSNVYVVGMVDDDPQDPSGVLGAEAELSELCAKYEVDDVLVAFSRKPTHETVEILRGLGDKVSVWVVPRLYELVSWRSVVDELHGIPLLDVVPAQAAWTARAVKRVFDIAVASALLVILSPVFAAVAVAIRTTSPGPVLFQQLRSGQHRQPFRIYKFRTMRVDAEQHQAALAALNDVDGPIFKMRNDPRVTRVGEWLRKTSLDELPQLLNVLRGEMSIVGPRPFPIEESDKITGWAVIRFSVPPGITGLWQVCGRSALNYDDLKHLDYIYAASWSFLWDLRILLQTPASVLHRRGVL